MPTTQESVTPQPILEAVNQTLEQAIDELRLAHEALQTSQQELHSLTLHLEKMHEEVDSLREEILRLQTGPMLDSAAS